MHWIDISIVVIPLLLIFFMGFKVRSYIRSVADFLSAGRLCGRYVISVADTATALSVIGIVAYVEVQYKTGFSLAFWNNLLLPVLIIMGLTGFCTYRYRETRAMSVGQFLEMRYSRKLRMFAATLRVISEILANAIMPAIAARFFIYFLGLPHHFEFLGISWQTFPVLMCLLLGIAIAIIWCGGALALVITDAIQGMFCFPLMALFAAFVLIKFSWANEIIPVMTDRVAGESFLNPFDIEKLRDFNAFSLALTIFVAVYHRGSWIGGAGASSAKTPHEQKMAGLLGMWRGSLATVFFVMVAICIITLLNHRNFSVQAQSIRQEISGRVAEEIIPDKATFQNLITATNAIPVENHQIGVDPARSESSNADTVYLDKAEKVLSQKSDGNLLFQKFRTLYYQLMLPVSLKQLLPAGMLGAFCLLMILAMISTDDSRIFGSAMTIAQDIILVLRKKPFTVEEHVRMIKWVSLGVGILFFIGSYFMAQLDYIQLFITLATMMWMCGCAPVMLFGLYSRFGTVYGAWCSLISGMSWALGSLFIQRNWADMVYPFLLRKNLVEPVGNFLEKVSSVFNPYIVWEMNPNRCPVNSYELYFLGMMLSLILYVTVSKLTLKKPFNLEKMLHRGVYAVASDQQPEQKTGFKAGFISKIVGITPQYTTFDRILAWGFAFFSLIYTFLISFAAVAIWNVFSPWPLAWWGKYFLIVSVVVPGFLAFLTGIWFLFGGIRDMHRLFRDLKDRVPDFSDDGRVSAEEKEK